VRPFVGGQIPTDIPCFSAHYLSGIPVKRSSRSSSGQASKRPPLPSAPRPLRCFRKDRCVRYQTDSAPQHFECSPLSCKNFCSSLTPITIARRSCSSCARSLIDCINGTRHRLTAIDRANSPKGRLARQITVFRPLRRLKPLNLTQRKSISLAEGSGSGNLWPGTGVAAAQMVSETPMPGKYACVLQCSVSHGQAFNS
jgi:hypothetical protein